MHHHSSFWQCAAVHLAYRQTGIDMATQQGIGLPSLPKPFVYFVYFVNWSAYRIQAVVTPTERPRSWSANTQARAVGMKVETSLSWYNVVSQTPNQMPNQCQQHVNSVVLATPVGILYTKSHQGWYPLVKYQDPHYMSSVYKRNPPPPANP